MNCTCGLDLYIWTGHNPAKHHVNPSLPEPDWEVGTIYAVTLDDHLVHLVTERWPLYLRSECDIDETALPHPLLEWNRETCELTYRFANARAVYVATRPDMLTLRRTFILKEGERE